MKSLLIGGNGFIGSHLAKKLIESGREVTVLCRSGMRTKESACQIKVVQGDYTNIQLIEKLIVDHDEIINLAYATVPNTSFDNPLADLEQNLAASVKLFELIAKHQKKLMLVSSGGTVYGEAKSLPISEEHPTLPISPYGVTKLTLEKYAYLYAVTKGLNAVCVRPANPYGEGQQPFLGQGFVATAIAMAMQNKTITIFGKTGTVRDYIYIDDLISGMFMLLEYGKNNTIYNIGSSIGRSNLDVVQAIEPLLNKIGVKLSVKNMPARLFDVKANVLDCSKLRNLGWQPNVDFGDGLCRTIQWLSQ